MYTCDCISDTLHESVIEVYTCDCIRILYMRLSLAGDILAILLNTLKNVMTLFPGCSTIVSDI